MSSENFGFNSKNSKIIDDMYKEVFAIQNSLYWLELVDIQRSCPKLWQAWCDIEDKLDARANMMYYDNFMSTKTEAIRIWNKIESTCKADVAESGIKPEKISVPWAITFALDKRKATEICEVGFITQQELDLYFQKKITVKELQMKNLSKREYAGEMLIGPVGLGQDGTGKRLLSQVIVPALQKSTQFAPDCAEKQCTYVHEINKPDTLLEMELAEDDSDGLLDIGAITVAWD
jgi:hypothetical protein